MDSQAISDRIEITDLISRYNIACDEDDFDTFVACFTEGGFFNGAFDSFKLPDEIERYKEHVSGISGQWPNLRHFSTNIQTETDGDAGAAGCFLMMTSTKPGEASQIVMVGTYTDELRRVDGEWRFVSRTVAVDGVDGRGEPPA